MLEERECINIPLIFQSAKLFIGGGKGEGQGKVGMKRRGEMTREAEEGTDKDVEGEDRPQPSHTGCETTADRYISCYTVQIRDD